MTVYRYWLSTLLNEGLFFTAPVVALWRAAFWATPDCLKGDDE
jgi:hypothetical protein